ncbi:flagellar basal-body rod protein FlgG [Anaplasmataceae bacterium AB001_6]|nr:flagellar basal-body rod protein FlgG [Anaplasmataceae bacterium AB001_6]
MSISIDSSTTGLIAQDTSLDVIANDLANASTVGYKRNYAVFSDLAYQSVNRNIKKNDDEPYVKQMQVGLGTQVSDISRIHEQGPLQTTGVPLDVAIVGMGMFIITMPDGEERYTRNGHFRLDANGKIVTSDGFELYPGITISNDIVNIKITGDGFILGEDKELTEVNLGQIELATFINPSGLQAMSDNLYAETVGSGPPENYIPGEEVAGTLSQGFLEGSNVNIVSTMTDMMKVHRNFDYCLKCLYTSHEMLKSVFNSNNKVT